MLLLQEDIPQFILLDEILKGTNSQDKLEDSKLFLQKMIQYPAFQAAFIATHDIEFAQIQSKYPTIIENYHFELQVNKMQLKSNYKIHKGIVKNMNAISLMQSMDII